MNDSHIDTLENAHQILDGTDEIDLAIDGKKNRYDFITRTRYASNTILLNCIQK